MLLRSSSLPFLSALVSEGDNDFFVFSKPIAAPRHCNTVLHNGGLPSTHTSSIRRAHSETDIEGFVHFFTEADDRISARQEKQQQRSFSKLFMIEEKEQSCFGMRSACPPASTSGLVSPQGKRLSPLIMASEIGISSVEKDVVTNTGGDFSGCDGGRGRTDGRGGPSSNPHGDSNSADLYYQRLLQSDPQNPLFLRNYAQFLSEEKHDYRKSEEYYERAILACPNDGEVLSKYAKHVWDVHKDSERAGSYFEQAVKATPEDCYVLASYASFLWQSDEEEEDANQAAQTAFHPLHGTFQAPSPLKASG